jgi:hypothetical protein
MKTRESVYQEYMARINNADEKTKRSWAVKCKNRGWDRPIVGLTFWDERGEWLVYDIAKTGTYPIHVVCIDFEGSDVLVNREMTYGRNRKTILHLGKQMCWSWGCETTKKAKKYAWAKHRGGLAALLPHEQINRDNKLNQLMDEDFFSFLD